MSRYIKVVLMGLLVISGAGCKEHLDQAQAMDTQQNLLEIRKKFPSPSDDICPAGKHLKRDCKDDNGRTMCTEPHCVDIIQ